MYFHDKRTIIPDKILEITTICEKRQRSERRGPIEELSRSSTSLRRFWTPRERRSPAGAADPEEHVNLVGGADYRPFADDLRERLAEYISAVEGATPELRPFENPGYREL